MEPTMVMRWVHASVARWVGWTALSSDLRKESTTAHMLALPSETRTANNWDHRERH
jgi:hypothetical protein